jgi:hypothetical protein
MDQAHGEVITGENVGFQIAGSPDRDGRIPGRVVIRVKGEWVETTAPIRVVR